MTDAPDSTLARPGDLGVALALLTRLPGLGGVDMARGARAAWAYPLAGAVLGALAGILGLLALALGLSPLFAAGVALTASVVISGALHEDGLADVADGFWGGWQRDKRLEIMRDSRIGSYGVIALALSLILRWAALAALFEAGGAVWAMIAVGALSRGGMVAVMAALPHARQDGLARYTGRPQADTLGLAALTSVAIGLLCLGFAAIGLALLVAAVALACAALARAKIGGQTGDVLGATQQVGEIALLAVLASGG